MVQGLGAPPRVPGRSEACTVKTASEGAGKSRRLAEEAPLASGLLLRRDSDERTVTKQHVASSPKALQSPSILPPLVPKPFNHAERSDGFGVQGFASRPLVFWPVASNKFRCWPLLNFWSKSKRFFGLLLLRS